MEANLDKIKKILYSQAGELSIESDKEQKGKIIDNRYNLIKENVDLIENKDNNFYTQLIKLLSEYIDEVYVPFILYFFNKNGKSIYNGLSDGTYQSYEDWHRYYENEEKLHNINCDLAHKLFEYICNILENNKDVTLDIETLSRLLNRKTQKLRQGPEYPSRTYRTYNFQKLVKIIKDNQMLEKMNITTDDKYQMIIDSYQIIDIITEIISPKEFQDNHKKIDELLMSCAPKMFVDITNIIIENLDNNYDVLDILQKRMLKIYKRINYEEFIIDLLDDQSSEPRINYYNFIHKLLNNKNISIDYNYCYSNPFGGSGSFKGDLSATNNRTIIKDLLSNPENIEDIYESGGYHIYLFELYAVMGEYKQAIDKFNESNGTNYLDKELTNNGYLDKGYHYGDPTAKFISKICQSFAQDNIEYQKRREILNKILINDNLKLLNLGQTFLDAPLPYVKETLSKEDFEKLLQTLIERYNNGNLKFIIQEETRKSMWERFTIRFATKEEIQHSVATITSNSNHKSLKYTKQPN